MPLLVLIDGHALAYRTFYAIPIENFSTRSGEPTNATYGFMSVLINVLRDQHPEYIAVCFDAGRTFRTDFYPEYKGTRAKLPPVEREMLDVQIARIHELLGAFNIPIFEQEGYEADDLLGTLAGQAAAGDVDTLIVTGDRDLLQLIGPRVRILLAGRKLNESELYDAEAVRTKYGVTPDQFVDYKALLGDKSDNIPGVPGIGEKGAAQLLQQYGTLEQVYADVGNVTPARARTALEKGRDLAFLSQRLSRIDRQTPVQLDLAACRAADYDRGHVAELFRALEFRTLLERLPAPTPPGPPAARGGGEGAQLSLFGEEPAPAPERPPVTQGHLVTTPKELRALVKQLRKAKTIAFDTEATGIDVMSVDLLGIALADRPGEGWYVAVNAPGGLDVQAALDILRPVLADPLIPKYAHNANYDMGLLQRYGLKVEGLAFDTMVAEWLCDPSSRDLGLKNLAWKRLDVEMTRIEELIGTGKKQITMAEVPLDKVAPYAAADADITLRLAPLLERELRDKGQWGLFVDVELPITTVLMEMEQVGVKLDVDALAAFGRELDARLIELRQEIQALAKHEFNVDSTQQLSDVLFKELGLPTANVPRTQAGKYSTAADVLEGLRGKHEIIELILEQRQLAKLKGTYVDALPALINARTGRVHTDYNQCGVVTGRISSQNPNLQNIPARTELGRRVRRAFIAGAGYRLLSADYSQIELRILAHISGDEALRAAFARDEDIHRSAAAAIFGVPLDRVTREQRQVGKTINFAVTYGQTAYGVSQVTGLSTEESQAIIDAYFARFPGVRTYLDETKRKAAELGYVQTLLGRRRYFPVLQGPVQKGQIPARQRAEREAINAPIQGTSADIMKLAMIDLSRALQAQRARSRLILQVHDELVLEVPDDELKGITALVCEKMEQAYTLAVALKVDAKVGDNWEEMDPVR
jgi:DNA polymerase-1